MGKLPAENFTVRLSRPDRELLAKLQQIDGGSYKEILMRGLRALSEKIEGRSQTAKKVEQVIVHEQAVDEAVEKVNVTQELEF